MAIVFISPHKKRKIFLWVAASVLIVFLLAVALVMLLPEFNSKLAIVPQIINERAFSLPEVKIKFQVVDSDQVKMLEHFQGVKKEFSYVAQDSSKKQTAGTIYAQSQAQAESILLSRDFTIISIKETQLGRNEPFTPY